MQEMLVNWMINKNNTFSNSNSKVNSSGTKSNFVRNNSNTKNSYQKSGNYNYERRSSVSNIDRDGDNQSEEEDVEYEKIYDDEPEFREENFGYTNRRSGNNAQSSDNENDSEKEDTLEDPEISQLQQIPRRDNTVNTKTKSLVGATSKEPMGCYQHMLKGLCSRGDKCTYSHDKKLLSKKCEEIEDDISEGRKSGRLYPRSSTQQQPSKILTRTINNVSVIDSEDDIDALVSSVKGYIMECDVQRNYLYNVSEATLVSASYHKGKIFHHKKGSISVPKILFDTGASSASYINKNFVADNLDKLGRFISKVKPSTVVLATPNARVVLDQVLIIDLEIVSPFSGVKYRKEITFYIMDIGSKDMIVGFPDMIKSFCRLHLESVTDIFNSMVSEGDISSETIEIGLNSLTRS